MASMGSNSTQVNSHGGPSKTGGTLTICVYDKQSRIVRRPVFHGKLPGNVGCWRSAALFFTDDIFRLSFFGSPLLPEIFLSQNKLYLLANSC